VVISRNRTEGFARSGERHSGGRWTGTSGKIGVILLFLLVFTALPLPAREKDGIQYGAGLVINIPFPEAEVEQVVQDIVQNGIIRGTKEYNKDEYISDATPATSTRVFSQWTEGGKVFYKVRLKALDPRNFKDSGDVGTLAVRYVVKAQGDKNTILRIDARFVEDFRKSSHPSNGSVESAEYKDIHDHLDAIESMKAQTAEAEKEKQEQSARTEAPVVGNETAATPPPASSAATNAATTQPSSTPSSNTSVPPPSSIATQSSANVLPPDTRNVPPANKNKNDKDVALASETPVADTPVIESLEQHVHDLRRQLQRLVKAPGAPLQSAPFHTAATLQSLPAGTEVLIVVSTPYWFGVETHEGQHGWVMRDQLEQLP
jgi:hypothetical protein